MYFLKDKQNENGTSRNLTEFVANDKSWALTWKSEFWKIRIHHWEPDSFFILEAFSGETGGDINQSDFLNTVKYIVTFGEVT